MILTHAAPSLTGVQSLMAVGDDGLALEPQPVLSKVVTEGLVWGGIAWALGAKMRTAGYAAALGATLAYYRAR